MKIVKSLPISTIVFLGTRAFKAKALLYSSGPLRRSSRPPRSLNVDCANGGNPNFASSPRNNDYKKRQERMDQVFRELQDEFGNGKRNSMDGQFNWVTMGLSQDLFKTIDKEATKKWTEKAFDLASEFNKDFAATSMERDTTDKYLQKSRDWVDRVYKDQENKATNDGQDSSLKQNDFLIASKTISNIRDNLPTPTPDKQRVFPIETANSEKKSRDWINRVYKDQENKATNDGQDSSSKQNNFPIASKKISNNNLPTPTPDKQRVFPTETANSEKKSRDWVNRVYKDQGNKATNDGQDSSSKQKKILIASKTTSNKRDNLPTPTPDNQRVFPTETVNSENRSNEEMFQVAVDLPGVIRADVDITINGDFLVIEATRQPGSNKQTTRKYIKRIAVVENEVDIDKMKASLNNGVLIVSAPKIKVTEIKRKIPIT